MSWCVSCFCWVPPTIDHLQDSKVWGPKFAQLPCPPPPQVATPWPISEGPPPERRSLALLGWCSSRLPNVPQSQRPKLLDHHPFVLSSSWLFFRTSKAVLREVRLPLHLSLHSRNVQRLAVPSCYCLPRKFHGCNPGWCLQQRKLHTVDMSIDQ